MAVGRGLARRGVEPAPVVMRGVGIAVAILILLPAGAILVNAFADPDGPGLTLSHFTALLDDRRFGRALANTLGSAFAAAVLATVLGVTLAWLVARTDMRWRRAFHVLNLVPFFLSPFVGALAWQILAAPNAGLLNKLLVDALGLSAPPLNVFSLGGLIWVLTLFYTPYVYLFCYGPMRTLDPALEDAAQVSGAGRVRTTVKVTLPLLAPAIFSGFLITFVTSAEIFDIPVLLTAPADIPTLSTMIYQSVQFPTDYNRAAALSTSLVAITMLGVWLQRRYAAGRSFATVTGKGYRPRRMSLGGWRWPALAIEIGYIGVAVILPLFGLLAAATSTVWLGTINPELLTLENFRYVMFSYDLTQTAFKNSMLLAVVGATLGCAIAVVVGHVVHRQKGRLAGVLDAVTTLPIGIPGIVLALGTLLVWIRTPLYGTLAILLLAYITRFLPYAQRSVSSGLLSISPELEQSARVSGAGWTATARRVLVPLLKPSLAAAWVMLFVIFVRELSTSVLLYRGGTEVMSVALLVLSERNLSYTAAYALLQTVLLLGVVGLFSAIFRLEEPKV
jgi:iron(III) transport system permease protein